MAASAPQEQKVQIPGVATGEVKIERPNPAISAPVIAQTPQTQGNTHDGFQIQGAMGGGHNGGVNGVDGDNLAATMTGIATGRRGNTTGTGTEMLTCGEDWDRDRSSGRSKSREAEHSKRRQVLPE